MEKFKSSEITPEHVYLSRRNFLKTAGVLVGGAVLVSACGAQPTTPAPAQPAGNASNTGASAQSTTEPKANAAADELGDHLTSYKDVTTYNNYYEFSTDKEEPARLAQNFKTTPWTVQVGGMVKNPKTYDLDQLKQKFTPVERVYRLRCVEAWSMVIPWLGFPVAALLKEVEPTAAAKYVRFEAVYDPKQLPGQNDGWFTWPYVEGLRLDEAMNDLAILATGLYGKDLTPQNGAPIRLVVPWKYGFKSIKAIVKIDLVDKAPSSLWMNAAPDEYGFYANVNPNVPHPRWSQSTERRIGELARRKTLMFNGYDQKVATLYQDLDLKKNY